MEIRYQTTLEGITPATLTGFFVGWPNPPDSQTHYRILKGSSNFVLALNDQTGQVVGFISAISDGVCCAFIPNLEVLPAFQNKGIGGELLRRLVNDLGGIYAIDLMCDPELQPYYERQGFNRGVGMYQRNFANQSGLRPQIS